MEPVESSVSIPLKDKKDIPILSLAHACGANYLITGDKELLKIKKYGICAIISPREAMEFFVIRKPIF